MMSLNVSRWSPLLALALLLASLLVVTPARAAGNEVRTAWRLLDYIAVDYPGAVSNGRIASPSEFAEMKEFAASTSTKVQSLPANPRRAALVGLSNGLQRQILAKADAEAVAQAARSLAAQLIAAYPVSLAPKMIPDPARGARLYAENCASCHGLSGNGQGPMAASLDPKPIAFVDETRARQRSIFGLYQVVDQGLDGTAMQSFAALPSQDKWALAFHVGRFAFPQRLAATGERLWKNDPALRKAFPDLAALTAATPSTLAGKLGTEKADAVTAYLRGNPGALAASSNGSLKLAHERLEQSLAAYAAGDHKTAESLALSAYLDGFEPLEPILAARDPALMGRIERAMGEVRGAIGSGRPVSEVRTQITTLGGLFAEAENALSPDAASDASTFVGAMTILLREGLEALLIVVAMIAFLRKADRAEVLSYVHGGWTTALLGGFATWFAATYLISVSGSSRELTEGFGSLFAAVVLVSVGIWMHGKSQAEEWQRYIKAKLGKALSHSSPWLLFLLAFVVVYREVFETVLFYAALWTQGNGFVILAGAGTGAAMLGVIAWAMLRYSRKLPITTFFAYSSALIAVLAVVLAGKGVAGLQEAGLLPVAPLSEMPRVALVGLYPSVQGLAAQIGVLLVIVVGFWVNRRRLVRQKAG